jgi:2,3-diketo-5-methylthiopentyl-1-phosphate enolase
MHAQTFGYAEELRDKGFILATYFLELPAKTDLISKAASFAIGQSIGTWVDVPGITSEMLEQHMARITAVYDIPPVELAPNLPDDRRFALVQIAFPETNFEAQFPMLFTTLLGNDVSTSTQLKLVDLTISASLASGFPGPSFGIDGLRQRLGIPHRPLLLNMIKPCTGFSPEQGAAFFAEAARSGVDIIKDDELLGNPGFNPLRQRVEAYWRAAEQVYSETGHRAIYCANITDRPERIMENAHRAQELGAGMVMLNTISVGLGMLQALAEDSLFNLPILSHFAGSGSLTESTYTGVSSPLLLGKLVRLAGADVGMFSSIYSTYPLLRDKYLRTAQMQRMPLYHIKPTLPVVGGGIHPASAVRIIRDLGNDLMLAVGGAIQGHPGGAAAGGRAMLQAIEAEMEGTSLREKARQHPELRQALQAWAPEALAES